MFEFEYFGCGFSGETPAEWVKRENVLIAFGEFRRCMFPKDITCHSRVI